MGVALRVASTLLFAAATLAAATWWALESSGVAIVETRAPDGSLRSTHVWFAESAGELWLEAGAPDHPWYRDIQREPAVVVSSSRRSGEFVARRVEEDGARERLRRLLREKYGVRDRWVALLFDTENSVAIRLHPVAQEAARSSPGR